MRWDSQPTRPVLGTSTLLRHPNHDPPPSHHHPPRSGLVQLITVLRYAPRMRGLSLHQSQPRTRHGSADSHDLYPYSRAYRTRVRLPDTPSNRTKGPRSLIPALRQHHRQPQREQCAHDDHGDEAHRAATAPRLPTFDSESGLTEYGREDPTQPRMQDVIEEGSSQEASGAAPGPKPKKAQPDHPFHPRHRLGTGPHGNRDCRLRRSRRASVARRGVVCAPRTLALSRSPHRCNYRPVLGDGTLAVYLKARRSWGYGWLSRLS